MTNPETAALARIRQMADYWEQHLPEVIRTPAVVSALRAALDAAAPAAVEPPADRAALRQRIAQALEEADYRPDMRRGDLADAIMPVLPAPADRAAVLREAIDVAREEGHRLEEEVGIEAARGARCVAYLLRKRLAKERPPRRMADETATTETQADSTTLLQLVRDFLDPDPCSFDHHGYCQAHAAGLGGEPLSCPHGRARKLLAALEQPAAGARPEACAHCGQPIRRITGTLAAWWVHDPGGNTVCDGARPAHSHRATPKQPPMDPVHILGIDADDGPAAGARQDGATP